MRNRHWGVFVQYTLYAIQVGDPMKSEWGPEANIFFSGSCGASRYRVCRTRVGRLTLFQGFHVFSSGAFDILRAREVRGTHLCKLLKFDSSRTLVELDLSRCLIRPLFLGLFFGLM